MVDKAGMARNLSEKNTRKEMIDPQLEKGGWYLREWRRCEQAGLDKALGAGGWVVPESAAAKFWRRVE